MSPDAVQKRASLHEKTVQAVAQDGVQVEQPRRRGKRKQRNGDVVVEHLHVAGRPDLQVEDRLAKQMWQTALKLAGDDRRRIRREKDGYVVVNG